MNPLAIIAVGVGLVVAGLWVDSKKVAKSVPKSDNPDQDKPRDENTPNGDESENRDPGGIDSSDPNGNGNSTGLGLDE